jgi:predicted transposase YbfD/YdcC
MPWVATCALWVKKIAEQIKQQGGDTVLSLKGSQGTLHDEVKTFLRHLYRRQWPQSVMTASMAESNHAHFVRPPILPGYKSGMAGKAYKVLSRSRPKEKSVTRALTKPAILSSLDVHDPKRLARVVRAHWAIENKLHGVFDIAFDDDSNRTRKGHRAANLAVIRHIALNLIKTEKRLRWE